MDEILHYNTNQKNYITLHMSGALDAFDIVVPSETVNGLSSPADAAEFLDKLTLALLRKEVRFCYWSKGDIHEQNPS